ncbi:methyl-accepting chemotaxis protein [Lachnoclostridium phytofermentans]|uniref:Methyl-accepting chemotaxis sensory transducer n=1 Tax=Lachnoclostridium phytofermentans (strain ATCC 700394 / DSM 18823 / ISDg) TaxID=357809 RepID=A9KHF6_LACP7|nr:HAMP domain-containing methyl-accepting chemotaxis protein [Lachnoclostridium phytofermentans]ABX40823.1 methyl-accepting chemotaxis sensory transducer [Lachnoclostridium phytofermentans ISDg]
MFNTIRKKLIAGFSLILIIIIASTVYNMYIYNNSRTHIISIRENAVTSYKYASEMKNNVIQVGQFLTDVSASKDTAQLKEAEEQYNSYKSNSEELASLNPEYTDQLNALNIEVDKFYTIGKEMADTYVKSGHEVGNIMMVDFDKAADKIYAEVDEIQKKSEAAMDDSLMTIQMHMDMNQNISTVLAIITIIIALLTAILLAGSITKPINNLLEIFKDLERGQGDLTSRINIKSKDELSRLARSFNTFMDSLESMMINIKKNSVRVSQGSELLSEGGMQTSSGVVTINTHMEKMVKDTQIINTSINQITDSIYEMTQASQDSANDAQRISVEVDRVNMLAQESGKLALDTKLEMENTEKISSYTIDIAEKLGNEAEEIGKIIGTIKSITDQTNMLALNAAIEAARAGEHGRGFSVVAEEIRNLAESNSQSAKTIEDIVKNIQDMIQKTMAATMDVGGDIKRSSTMVENVYTQLNHIIDGVKNINNRIQNIAAITEEQSASTEELSATMESINDSNTAITSAMQEVAASISTQTDTITGLSTTASDLNESAKQLNELVSKFKFRES